MTTDVLDKEDFLDSHRALAVCAREFDRLAEDVAKRVAELEDESKGWKADVRRSPGRCIVQIGPVALTLSWLRTRGLREVLAAGTGGYLLRAPASLSLRMEPFGL